MTWTGRASMIYLYDIENDEILRGQKALLSYENNKFTFI